MKEAIKQLSFLFAEHLDGDKDITVVLNTRDMLELIQYMDLTKYNYSHVSYDGEFHYISSNTGDVYKSFYVEDTRTSEGIMKENDTDILIIPSNLPQLLINSLLKGDYKTLVKMEENSTYETLINQI
jgi:hypothetical protein